MKNKLKTIEKNAAKQMKERHYKKDADGRAIISMNVKNDDDFLSEFSENDTCVISSDVAEFIENSTDAIPLTEELALHISSSCIDDHEKTIYSQAIKEYYLQRYIANEREIRRNRLLVILFGIAGVLVLAAQIIYDYVFGNAIWTEVIDIIAWVLIWEATDIGLIQTKGLRIKKKRYLSYLSMKIEYIES